MNGVDSGRVRLDSSSGNSSGGSGKSSAPWTMLEELGMRPVEVAAVVTAYPLLLTVSASKARAVVRWLAVRAGLSSKQIVNVIKRNPIILRMDAETRLEPHAEWLEKEGLTTSASIGKAISKAPQMLGLDIAFILSSKTAGLRSYLGFSTDEVASVLKSFPAVLARNVESMEAKAAWLERRLDMDRPAVSKMIKRRPALLAYNVENLESKLVWLRDGLGLEERDIAIVVPPPFSVGEWRRTWSRLWRGCKTEWTWTRRFVVIVVCCCGGGGSCCWGWF